MLGRCAGVDLLGLLGLLRTVHWRNNLWIEPPPELFDTDRLSRASASRGEDLLRRDLLKLVFVDEGFARLFVNLEGSSSD